MKMTYRRLGSRRLIVVGAFAAAIFAGAVTAALADEPTPSYVPGGGSRFITPPPGQPGQAPFELVRYTNKDIEQKIKSLRQVAAKLESSAGELEELDAYEAADKLRETAKSLRD